MDGKLSIEPITTDINNLENLVFKMPVPCQSFKMGYPDNFDRSGLRSPVVLTSKKRHTPLGKGKQEGVLDGGA